MVKEASISPWVKLFPKDLWSHTCEEQRGSIACVSDKHAVGKQGCCLNIHILEKTVQNWKGHREVFEPKAYKITLQGKM